LFFKIQAISPSPKNPGFGFLGEGREGGGGYNSPLNALSKIDGINADNSFPVSAFAGRHPNAPVEVRFPGYAARNALIFIIRDPKGLSH
jgi:hypothetical protein